MIELLLQAERALSVGLLDRAETLYRQVARADPRNSIAVVGLARVTLDRGDEEGALELARRALAIDPENVAAQRMVARLEEVMDYRVDAEAEIASVVLRPEGSVAELAPVDAEVAEASVPAELEPEVAAEFGVEPGIVAEPEAEPEIVVEPAPSPGPTASAPPDALAAADVAPEPGPLRRRSFLDRLFGRH
jgi:tetratricopeptide (TPR) repeat protein